MNETDILHTEVTRLRTVIEHTRDYLISQFEKCTCGGTGQDDDGEAYINERCPNCVEERALVDKLHDTLQENPHNVPASIYKFEGAEGVAYIWKLCGWAGEDNSPEYLVSDIGGLHFVVTELQLQARQSHTIFDQVHDDALKAIFALRQLTPEEALQL